METVLNMKSRGKVLQWYKCFRKISASYTLGILGELETKA